LIWICLLVYIFVALSFTSTKRKEVVCSNLKLIVNDTFHNRFLDREDILKLLEMKYKRIIGTTIDSLDVSTIENIINAHPVIKQAQIYKTIYGTIEIEIEQRNPILRIYDAKNNSFYIDDSGAFIPTSPKYAVRTLIANGQIKALSNANKKIVCEGDTIDQSLCDLFKLAKFIYNSNFWSAQIEQIYITENNEFELIPKVGDFIIQFGNISEMEGKFEKLDAMYNEAFKRVGWNKYKAINLKFKDQVICVKR